MVLRDLIRNAGWLQREVAEELGISESAVSRWIHGYADVPSHLVKPLARMLNVDVRDIAVWGIRPHGELRRKPASQPLSGR